MATKIWHVLELLEWTTNYFDKYGIPNPRLDAELLLGHLLEKNRLQLYLHFDMPVFQEQLTAFRNLIKKRIAYIPISYITNHKEFMSLDFYIDERVLVPRPETEFLVEAIFKMEIDAPHRLLEIGTGSGIIATTLALHAPTWEIIATDISKEALAVAQKNRDAHGCIERITLLHGDLFEPIQQHKLPRFDCVVSNPPYLISGENDALGPGVREHEPHIALFAGEDGLDVIRRLIAEAPNHLNPGGKLIFEIGYMQAEAVKPLLKADPSYQKYQFIKDYAGIERVVIATIA